MENKRNETRGTVTSNVKRDETSESRRWLAGDVAGLADGVKKAECVHSGVACLRGAEVSQDSARSTNSPSYANERVKTSKTRRVGAKELTQVPICNRLGCRTSSTV